MRLTSIALKNFRRFQEFQCRFDPAITLLMGPNGSGKTSLLRAIHLALASLRQSAGMGHDEYADGEVFRINSVDPSGEAWRTPVFPSWVRAAVDILGLGERSFGCERDVTSQFFRAPGDPDAFRNYSEVGALVKGWFDPEYSAAIPLIARFGAQKPTGKAHPDAVHKPFEAKQDIWKLADNDASNIRDLAQWFQFNELRQLQEGKAPLVYKLVREAALSAIHADDIRYVVRDNALMIRHDQQGWRPFDQLSDGQLRLAALVCDVAMRGATLNSHLGESCIAKTPGIVTIDDFDLHLHPKWQRTVVSDLRRVFPMIQFIVTSHSPFLLQAAFEYGSVIDMSTGEFAQATDMSIEDIAESVMDVDQPQRGVHFLQMKSAAQRFYELLRQPAHTPDEEARLKQALDEALALFANDPASAAWLEQRRASRQATEMRSVDKGDHPVDATGRAVSFGDYRDAAPHLKSRLGRYCSYCERTVPVSLAVEHKRPKQYHPALENSWSNLLLACANCNSSKGTQDLVEESAVWPDEHDTFSLIAYSRSGEIGPRPGLSEEHAKRAIALLSLLGLCSTPVEAAATDHRWFDRLEVWRKAEQSCDDIALEDSNALRRAVLETAKSSGGFSIWMAAFDKDADMRERLMRHFPGTRRTAAPTTHNDPTV